MTKGHVDGAWTDRRTDNVTGRDGPGERRRRTSRRSPQGGSRERERERSVKYLDEINEETSQILRNHGFVLS